MRKSSKRIIALSLFATLLLVVGGFCVGPQVEAAFEIQRNANAGTHCGQHVSESKKKITIQKNSGGQNALMPCCIERHDNSGTIIPTTSIEQAKIMQSFVNAPSVVAVDPITQKLFSCDSAPPRAPDKLSSLIRIE